MHVDVALRNNTDKNAFCDRNDLEWLNMICVIFCTKNPKIIEFFSRAVPSRQYTVSFLSVLLIWWCRSIISDCSSGINGCINHSFIFNSTSFAQFSTTFFGFVFRFLRKKINPKSCHFLTKNGKKQSFWWEIQWNKIAAGNGLWQINKMELNWMGYKAEQNMRQH